MLGVHLPKDLEERLDKLASKTKRSKSYHTKKALQEYLEEKELYLLAAAALEEDDGTRYSLEEVEKLAGLND